MEKKELSAADYRRFIEKLFLIVTKESKSQPFILNEPQNKILDRLSGRDIILKARQEGISSLILALFTVDFLLKENIRCVVISHEKDATQKLFDKVKFYLESMKQTFPGELPYELTYNSRHEMVNKAKNSVFYIGTAGAKAFGHGDTINNLHASEVSRWPDQERLLVGLLQAVPRSGRVIIETTANGMGDYFFKLWKRSQEANSTFKTHFLPWFAMKEYAMPCREGFQSTEEEVELQKVYGLSHEQLNWRRWKIAELNDNLDAFNEQFPSNAEEAFIVSGNPIWSPTLLKWYDHRCEEPVAVGDLTGSYKVFFEENPKGFLKIWRAPNVGHDYVIGADVAEGISSEGDDGLGRKEGDYSVAYVLDRQTAELVACWHGHIAGDQFGRQLDLLGRFYNQAFIGVEKNYQGLAPLIMLRDLNYPYLYYREKIGMDTDKSTGELGWRTDRFTRPMMIEEGGKWLRERRLTIYDRNLVGEMLSFIRYPDGQGRAAPSSFDDRVISMLITIQMYLRNPRIERGNEMERGGESYSLEQGGAPMDMDMGDSLDMGL